MKGRLRLEIRGDVQGVGFRPYVHRLAGSLGLAGWVCNGPRGVTCEVEGPLSALEAFQERLPRELPPRAAIRGLDTARVEALGESGFEIRPSLSDAAPAFSVPADSAPCPDCLRELRDPSNRRYRHPFISCTRCGPRYSVLESLPWDRVRTTMKEFPFCPDCRREYEDPADRRFHAEPLACPACGPSLTLLDPGGRLLAVRDEALGRASRALAEGLIVAVKSVGGFQLMTDACSETAVRRLRERKAREEKPFAVLLPDLETVRRLGRPGPIEEELIAAPEAPIVLIRRGNDGLAPSVAPGNPWLGLLLPPSPLHELLAGPPLVATSGNLSDEPLCIGNAEALERLGGIADLFLMHDRGIVRPLDDSVVRVIDGAPCFLRRGRGYAPYGVPLPRPVPAALAVGAQLKGSVALGTGRLIVVGPHLGDLGSVRGYEHFRQAAGDLPRLLEAAPGLVLHDAHPDYRTTRHARDCGLPARPVQHHHAHVFAAMAEHGLEPPVLGVAWDGTGWGPDGSVWGGEFLRVEADGVRRAGHLRTFRLPGGEAAVREPRRSALGVLFELFGRDLPAPPGFEDAESGPLLGLLDRGVNSPRTSSAGRLFDAAAALCGLRLRGGFEGQAAMALEFALDASAEGRYDIGPEGDWGPLLRGLLADLARGESPGRCSARFHRGMADLIADAARREGIPDVVLSGGCFQNRALAEEAVRRLREEGFRPRLQRRIPPNDGGIAAGQIASLLWRQEPCV